MCGSGGRYTRVRTCAYVPVFPKPPGEISAFLLIESGLPRAAVGRLNCPAQDAVTLKQAIVVDTERGRNLH